MSDFDTTLRAILSESGLDNPGSDFHSWRCAHPDQFPGYCHCVDDLVTDITAAHVAALAEAYTLMGAAVENAIEAEQPRVLTADDPEPAVGSVVLDRHGLAWQRERDGLWRTIAGLSGADWGECQYVGPVTLIHDGGAE